MKALMVLLAVFLGCFAQAQEFAGLVGVHQTSADASNSGVSVDGQMNFKAGLAVRFELMEKSFFRTGALYNQRHIETSAAGVTTEINFDYLDVPATFQYGINEMFGIFGGMVVAVNINDDVSVSSGTAADPDADTMVPMLTLGANLTFDDMIGFDFYYERGMGGFAEGLENYTSFGANFLYWF